MLSGTEYALFVQMLENTKIADYFRLNNREQLLSLASRFSWFVEECIEWGTNWFWVKMSKMMPNKLVWIAVYDAFVQGLELHYWSNKRHGWMSGRDISYWNDEASARKESLESQYRRFELVPFSRVHSIRLNQTRNKI